MLSLFLVLLLASIVLHKTSGAGVPEGWRQSDRFVGFRYQLSVSTDNKEHVEDTTAAIQGKADQLFCFGWVQNNTMTTHVNEGETLVGEARCRTNAGNDLSLKSFLSSLAVGEDNTKKKHIVFKDYEDTLIRLHFSHFKIVSPGRNTCFRDEPHQCRLI